MNRPQVIERSLGVALLCLAGCSTSPMMNTPSDLASETPDGSTAMTADMASGSLATLSDEFSSPQLSGWVDLFPTLHSTLSLSEVSGRLSMAPVAASQTHWFSDQHGPLQEQNESADAA